MLQMTDLCLKFRTQHRFACLISGYQFYPALRLDEFTCIHTWVLLKRGTENGTEGKRKILSNVIYLIDLLSMLKRYTLCTFLIFFERLAILDYLFKNIYFLKINSTCIDHYILSQNILDYFFAVYLYIPQGSSESLLEALNILIILSLKRPLQLISWYKYTAKNKEVYGVLHFNRPG